MKYLFFFLTPLLFMGCNRTPYVEFTGNAPGISAGAIVIRDQQGTQILSETIIDGKFHAKKILPAPGYYNMFIMADIVANDAKKKVYDIYLEKGAYTIEMAKDKLYLYPTIKSASKIQNELSDYYTVATAKKEEAKEKASAIAEILYGKNSNIVRESGNYESMVKELKAANAKRDNMDAVTLEDYVNKHPDNEVAAHIMSQMDYKKDPVSFYRIYQKFTAAAKNSDEGKTEKDDLDELLKMAPGGAAPLLQGTTIDGKPFDSKSVNKKVILVEFWRSDSELSRTNHKDLLNEYNSLEGKDFTILSVSLDTKKDVWAEAVRKDKMNWTQINDLKGENSPNMKTWLVNAIPTYDLLDGNWHFIKRDVPFDSIGVMLKTKVK